MCIVILPVKLPPQLTNTVERKAKSVQRLKYETSDFLSKPFLMHNKNIKNHDKQINLEFVHHIHLQIH